MQQTLLRYILSIHTFGKKKEENKVLRKKSVFHLFFKMYKRKSKHDVEMEVNFFRSKLKDELDQRLEITLKENCFLMDGKIFMTCIHCGESKERTTEHFHLTNGGRNFLTCRAGYEALNNSQQKPCKICYRKISKDYHNTRDGFIQPLISHYKEDGLTTKWFWEKFKEQKGCGPISGKQLQFVPNGVNCVGIHKYDNDKNHTQDNCFLEVQELNVCQHEAIPCLFCAWKQLFNCLLNQRMFPEQQDNVKHLEYVRSQYFITAGDIGIINARKNHAFYARQKRLRYFPTILRGAIQDHIKADLKRKRFKFPSNISRKKYLKIVYDNSIQQLEKQSWKCGYTNVNLTIENFWTRFSFERINNDLPHFTQLGELTNIVFVCRLLNVQRQLSKEKITDYLLYQNLLPIPDYVRVSIDANSSFDQVSSKLWTQREIDLLEFTSLKKNNTLSCDYCFLKNQIKNLS
jgi:hypothetical protein